MEEDRGREKDLQEGLGLEGKTVLLYVFKKQVTIRGSERKERCQETETAMVFGLKKDLRKLFQNFKKSSDSHRG